MTSLLKRYQLKILQFVKMTDLPDFSSSGKPADSELQDFLLVEKQKAQFHAQVILHTYYKILNFETILVQTTINDRFSYKVQYLIDLLIKLPLINLMKHLFISLILGIYC